MREKLKEAIRLIDEISKKKLIKVISHYDTDGITSAAIFTRALERWNKKFSLQIVKGLDEQFIETLPEDQILIFLDLASGSLDYLGEKKTEVISNFKSHAKDTGSPAVQIALLSEKISYLTEHFKTPRKDYHSRRGLLMMIGQRRRLLAYLKKSDSKKYEEILKKLNLRK